MDTRESRHFAGQSSVRLNFEQGKINSRQEANEFHVLVKLEGEWSMGADVAEKTWRFISMHLTEVIRSDRMAPVFQVSAPGLMLALYALKKLWTVSRANMQTCRGKHWIIPQRNIDCELDFLKCSSFWSFRQRLCFEASSYSVEQVYQHTSVWATNAKLIEWIKYPCVRHVVIAADMRSLGQQPATGENMRNRARLIIMSRLFPQAWGRGALYYFLSW